MIKNPDFLLRTHRALQPLRWGANVLFLHPPHVPSTEQAAPGAARDRLGERSSPRTPRSPSSRRGERKGARGKVRSARLRRSTSAETAATLFQRVVETHASSTNVPLTIMEMLWSSCIKSSGFLIML